MRNGVLGAWAGLLTSAGLALGQAAPGPGVPPAPLPPAPMAAPLPPPPGGPPVPVLPGPGPEGPPPVAAGPWVEGPGLPVSNSRVFVNLEYLHWWFKDSPLPLPLVTTTTDLNSQPLAGIGQDATSVLVGNRGLDTGSHEGARFTGGFWFDNRQMLGVEGGYFFLASHTNTRAASSSGLDGSPVLAVPFFDADAGAESSFPLANPGSLAGSAFLSLTSRMQGAEINGVVETLSGGLVRCQVLVGFRFLELRENLSFATASLGIQDPTVAGSNNGQVLYTRDQFDNLNRFFGGQVGTRFEVVRGNLSLNAWGKVALGNMYQVATVNGSATTNFFNAPAGGPFTGVPTQDFPGAGIFAQASNIGRTTANQLTVVPELNVSLGYQLTRGVRAFIGYDFLYVSSVIRPGNQIDRSINVSQTLQSAIAGNTPTAGTLPAINLAASDFWAQGINFGIEWNY